MNAKQIGRAACVGLAGSAAFGLTLLLASNTGFSVEYTLLGTAGSASGTNWIGLPYQTELQTAGELFAKLGGTADVTSIARRDPLTDTLEVYTGGSGTDFALTPGEGLIVTMKNTVVLELVGSHDPNLVLTLLGPEDSATGLNQYAHPYNAVAGTASQLKDEIASTCGTDCVLSLARFIRSNDSLQTYTGSGGTDFPLTPGEAYRVVVDQTVQFVPSVVK